MRNLLNIKLNNCFKIYSSLPLSAGWRSAVVQQTTKFVNDESINTKVCESIKLSHAVQSDNFFVVLQNEYAYFFKNNNHKHCKDLL